MSMTSQLQVFQQQHTQRICTPIPTFIFSYKSLLFSVHHKDQNQIKTPLWLKADSI